MGTASSRLDEVQPPDDWQPSSNNVGFRLISPTSDISDPSCRIQQQQQYHKESSLPASHLTPTLERRRTSKVVARNLPPRPRPVPTPSSFYFPTRESEDMVDRKGIETKAQKAKRRQAEEASKRRLSKTKESIQKRALQAKQCLAACIEEPMHQIEKIKDRRAEAKAESSKENVQNHKDLDLNYNRLSTDTTRSVNAAIAKGDIRKKKNKQKWEPRVVEISETDYLKAAPFVDDAEGHFSRRASAPVPFEPVFRESHITMVTTDQAGQASAIGASTPLDPMFTVDIALHHEEAYFKRLSAASEYGVSPGVGFTSHEAKLPQPTPLRDHYISSPDSFGINASKDVTEAEIDSPVASLFMNDMFDSNPQDTKLLQAATIVQQPDDKEPSRSASTKAADSKTAKIDTKKKAEVKADSKTPKIDTKNAEVKVPLNVPTERKSNVSSVRLDPTEAEDWLTLGAIVSPKAPSVPDQEVRVDDKKAAETPESNQSGKVLVSTKMRKDSPFRPLVRGFASRPFPIIKSLIAKSPSADYHPTENARQKKEPKLNTRSFDDYGAVHKLWLLPNVLAAAKAISGLDQGSGGKGTPTMSRWKTNVMSPSEESTHSSMMMSPGPLLTDQVLCNAAFLFSPSYVGGLDRLMPSRRSDSVGASHSPLANMITTHGSRSHLADYSRRSYPPVTIPISDSQQLLLRNSHEPRESSRGGSLESKRVRFSLGDESTATSTTTKKSETIAPVGKDALAPALKKRSSDPLSIAFTAPEVTQRPSTTSSIAFKGFHMPTTTSHDLYFSEESEILQDSVGPLDVSEESEILQEAVPPVASSTSSSPRRSSASSGTWSDQQKSVTFQAPSTPVAFSDHGSPAGFSDKGTPDSFSLNEADEDLDKVSGKAKDRCSTNSNGSGSTASMYWSYRSANGETSAVTPMLGKKSAKLATNSPFLRFKAAKNRFSNPPTKTTPVRKAQRKLADVSNGGIVSSRVTEIDGRLKCTRPRSLKKAVKRGSGVMTSRADMVEKPVFRNPVIMGFKAASSFNEGDEKFNRESLTVSLGRADQDDRRNSGGSYSQPESRRSSSSFPMNDAEKSTLNEVYQQLNRAPASSVGSARYSTVTESSSANNLQKVSTPSSVGPFMAFDGTPVSPDHSEATDITKRGTLRTPLQRNPDIFSALKLSMSSAGVSPEPSPLGSYSVESGSSGLSSPFGALKLQEDTEQLSFSHQSVDPSRLYERRDTISNESDVSDDMFATLMNSDGRALVVSDSSGSQEDSELDPFQSELIRPSFDESAAKSHGRHQLESAPSQRSLLSETTSGESSRFSTLRRDASLRSLAAESHRSYASGSTTLSAIMQKENMSYLPFRAEAPVKPSQLVQHATPGALNLSPLQRTPMQASKWRTLAAAAHEKRKNQKQIKNGSSRGGLSERKSINQMTN